MKFALNIFEKCDKIYSIIVIILQIIRHNHLTSNRSVVSIQMQIMGQVIFRKNVLKYLHHQNYLEKQFT